MKNDFFDSYHCTSKFHCKTCRDIDNEDFRKQVMENFDGVTEVNFECPHGMLWGTKEENIESPKEIYNDRNMVNIDLVKKQKHLFEKIEGLQAIIDDYERRIKKSKCSPCLRAKINRGINKVLVTHIQIHKDMRLLNSLKDTLILADGVTNKQVSEWKSEIKNVLQHR